MLETRDNPMGRVRHIHFVGIGGAGMSGIAEILHNLGYQISGSDLKESQATRHLKKLGITVNQGHAAGQVKDSDVVVVSSAVTAENPDIDAARRLRIPVIRRAEMLAEIMRFRHGIAIAGTHGKTTTTSLVASLLAEGGLDPTFVIGGQLNSIGSNARLGGGKYLVAEADESDASFLYLQPMMAILTNIDADHLETYDGDFRRLSRTFLEFIHRLPFYGLAVLCVDDTGIREILNEIKRPIVTYALDQEADFMAINLRYDHTHTSFTVSRRGRPDWLQVSLNLPGRHNVQNALGAIAIAVELGVPDAAIIKALRNFGGIDRRCNVLGSIHIDDKEVTIIDDYAHHPTEIRATMSAVRSGWPGIRLVVVFQPHRHTRTRDLFDQFCKVLGEIDVLLLLHVYPAGEQRIAGADSPSLYNAIAAQGTVQAVLVESRADLMSVLPGVLMDKDILLIMGAGDIGLLGGELINRYSSVH
jgi:UDP-N-acetylmuramate--alanine ligase